jgi:hypothetical protein
MDYFYWDFSDFLFSGGLWIAQLMMNVCNLIIGVIIIRENTNNNLAKFAQKYSERVAI